MARWTILFVDDDALIRGLYVELLREEGFAVVEASNGTEALKALERMEGDCLVIRHETEEIQLTRDHPVAVRPVSK